MLSITRFDLSKVISFGATFGLAYWVAYNWLFSGYTISWMAALRRGLVAGAAMGLSIVAQKSIGMPGIFADFKLNIGADLLTALILTGYSWFLRGSLDVGILATTFALAIVSDVVASKVEKMIYAPEIVGIEIAADFQKNLEAVQPLSDDKPQGILTPNKSDAAMKHQVRALF